MNLTILDKIKDLLATEFGLYFLIINAITCLCVCLIFFAIFVNFAESKDQKTIKNKKKSIVETGTMTLFFFGVYSLITLRIGQLHFEPIHYLLLSAFGSLILVFGTFFNIWGRLYLGKNWGNQIIIYEDHKLIVSGPYKIVRHPLYASLIWMFYGASLIYLSYAVLLANTLIFLPFMYYRAKQEEFLLSKQFVNYKDYTKRTGMFFPKFFQKNDKN